MMARARHALQYPVPRATVVSDSREEVVLAGGLPHCRAGELLQRLARRRDAALQQSRLVVIPAGTHQVFLERNRDALFDVVRRWWTQGLSGERLL